MEVECCVLDMQDDVDIPVAFARVLEPKPPLPPWFESGANRFVCGCSYEVLAPGCSLWQLSEAWLALILQVPFPLVPTSISAATLLEEFADDHHAACCQSSQRTVVVCTIRLALMRLDLYKRLAAYEAYAGWYKIWFEG